MRHPFLLLVFFLIGHALQAQHIMTSKNASISFFSSTVLEDIEAKSNTASSALDLRTGELIFKVSNTSFQFKKKLMQEHFNENYMESEKYPFSEFKGKIIGDYNPVVNGTYPVKVEGILSIHGVSKIYQNAAELVVNGGKMTASTSFKVRIADHKIQIPSLVFKNIAEFVEVKILALYQSKN
ncbi:YceI family protein [Pedobacter sp. PWIIR3]